MANNYQRGDLITVAIDPSTGAVVELSVKTHTLDLESLTHDVTGTAHRGQTARIGGKEDARATVTACFDLDQAPYADPPSIKPNLTGVLFLGVSEDGLGIQVPYIINHVHYESSVETEVRYSFDIQYNSLAGTFAYDVQI